MVIPEFLKLLWAQAKSVGENAGQDLVPVTQRMVFELELAAGL